jgi:hypothetical protein
MPDRSRNASRLAVVSLIAANLIPLIGVLSGQWNLLSLMVLYWAENGVIGVYCIPKIILAGRGSGVAKWILVAFFIVHYFSFWLGHGVVVSSSPASTVFDSGPHWEASGRPSA